MKIANSWSDKRESYVMIGIARMGRFKSVMDYFLGIENREKANEY